MALDTRLPGIYVSFEDRSSTTESIDTGRSGYVVILSDRGPHNRVVEVNSRQDFYDLFGEPDFLKYGHGHYLADQFLTRSSKLYVCRPVMLEPIGDSTYDDCMTVSNRYIAYNSPNSAETVLGNYSFIQSSNMVISDSTSLTNLSVGDWIFPTGGDSDNAAQIIDLDSASGEITLDRKYAGTSITDSIKTYQKFEFKTISAMKTEDNCDILDQNVIWYIFAYGAGKPYNNYFISGVRNSTIEKMYLNSNGDALYPYAFMDIAVYKKNDDDTTSLVEGPWTVSLINKTGSGTTIRDVYTGNELYIVTVVNRKSKIIQMLESLGANKLMTTGTNITYPYTPDVNNRIIVQSMLSRGDILGRTTVGSGGMFLESGTNGSLFDENNTLNYNSNTAYQTLVASAYDGSLESTDGSVELIVQDIYPAYQFDYILCGGYGANAAYSAKTLVDLRDDCLLLADTGANYQSADEDLTARENNVPWNSYNAALYVQYRQITDTSTGREFYITPVYHAIDRHLYTDTTYWISEPVAGIEKGAIEESITLSYRPKITKMGDLVEAQMNPTIVEPDGTYFITQLTTLKKLSVMQRQHVVKFMHYIKKKLPSVLKDVVQRKATTYWLNEANERVNGFMNPFVDQGDSDNYASITSYDATLDFDDSASELTITLTVTPIRAIEKVTITILVV